MNLIGWVNKEEKGKEDEKIEEGSEGRMVLDVNGLKENRIPKRKGNKLITIKLRQQQQQQRKEEVRGCWQTK